MERRRAFSPSFLLHISNILAKFGQHRKVVAGLLAAHAFCFCYDTARCEAGSDFRAGEDVVDASGWRAGRAGKAFCVFICAAKAIDVASVAQQANGAARDVERSCAVEERAEEGIMRGQAHQWFEES